MSKIILVGIDHNGLTPEKGARLKSCQALFSSQRFRNLLEGWSIPILPITPLPEALVNMQGFIEGSATIGILASGDPLFFGIAQTLIQRFGTDLLELHPALSSMQLAFARLKIPWQDATFFSLHGRDQLPPGAFFHHKIFIFTDRRNTPNAVAQGLLRHCQQRCRNTDIHSYELCVLENIGQADEKISRGSASEIASQQFGSLNVLIILRHTLPAAEFTNFGLGEEMIQHSRGLITKDEVRAVVLHKLQLPATGVFWDIGAGSGSISVEAARLNPTLKIFSVERNANEHTHILANQERYGLANMSLVKGQAPEALSTLPPPHRVFIGGSGGNLPAIVQHISQVLDPKGRIVITAVTDTTRSLAPELLSAHGFQVSITDIQVHRRTYPATSTDSQKLNPITIITGTSNER